jgi:hypothetical protein
MQVRHEEFMKNMAEQEQPYEDDVNHPAHYQGSIETWDYIVSVVGEYAAIDVARANLIKYTGSRLFKKGNPIKDAKKARWYLDKMIELLEKTEGKNW